MTSTFARELELMNPVNRCHRRCVIGKVRPKARAEDNPAYRAVMHELRYFRKAIEQSSDKWRLPTSGGYVPISSSADVPIVPMHGVML